MKIIEVNVLVKYGDIITNNNVSYSDIAKALTSYNGLRTVCIPLHQILYITEPFVFRECSDDSKPMNVMNIALVNGNILWANEKMYEYIKQKMEE